MMKLDFHFMGMHRNLYWYMGMFAMGLGVARSFIIQNSCTSEAHEPLLSCISYANYYPRHWREYRLSSIEVYNEFADLFMLNVAIPGLHRSIFVQEMLGVIITPFILWFVMPDKAGEILTFLRSCTVEKRAVNCICSFADFSPDGFTRHGAMNFGPDTQASMGPGQESSRPNEASSARGSEECSRPGAGGGGGLQPAGHKFQQSFIGFKANNPQWEPPQEGQQLLSRLMETIELRPDPDVDQRAAARRDDPPVASRCALFALAASGASASMSQAHREAIAAANAAAAFISSSHFLPPEDAEGVHGAVFQRFMTYGSLIGSALPPTPPGASPPERAESKEARAGALWLSSGARWGGGGHCYRPDAEPYRAGPAWGGHTVSSVSGRQLEIDEHLLNVLLMEYSESYAAGHKDSDKGRGAALAGEDGSDVDAGRAAGGAEGHASDSAPGQHDEISEGPCAPFA